MTYAHAAGPGLPRAAPSMLMVRTPVLPIAFPVYTFAFCPLPLTFYHDERFGTTHLDPGNVRQNRAGRLGPRRGDPPKPASRRGAPPCPRPGPGCFGTFGCPALAAEGCTGGGRQPRSRELYGPARRHHVRQDLCL